MKSELTTVAPSQFGELLQAADLFAKADIVPKAFQGNPGNCFIAVQLASRMNADPFMVMQNVDIIHGKPGFSSKFLIGCFNTCGRFGAIQYEHDTEDGGRTRAVSTEIATGRRIEGPWVSMAMAKAEGWIDKNGSKWKTMPELMRSYRAAAFMIRLTAPEVSLGLPTSDEIRDTGGEAGMEVRDVTPRTPFARARAELPERTEEAAETEPPADLPPVPEEEAKSSPLDELKAKIKASGVKVKEVASALASMGIGDGETSPSQLPEETIAMVVADWGTVFETIVAERAAAAADLAAEEGGEG